MGFSRNGFALLLLLTLTACNTVSTHRVHYTLLDKPQPKEAVYPVLLLPADISVKEMSASGLTQEVGSWCKEAKGHVDMALAESGDALGRLRPVKLPALSEKEQELVEQYTTLYDTVAGAAIYYTRNSSGTAWEHKIDHFDYSLGPGLAFLAEKTGVERALIITGEDVISSGGRKAAFVVAAMLGVSIPLGHTVLIAGVVDLRTGDLHWLDYAVSLDSETLRDPDDVRNLLNGLFDSFPGVEEMAGRRKVARQ